MKEKFANEVTKYDNVTVEQWAELRAMLYQTFRHTDAGKPVEGWVGLVGLRVGSGSV